ncbi:22160_t:CDS:2 [Gigaspora rosea]|nr:22160_t:CDS:2 [Gigaspora rosea]
MFYDRDCNSYITDPLEKDGSYYNGYFSIPLENSYKLALSNNTKYGKRSEQEIRFFLQILDLNVDLNASYLVQISDSENVDLGRNISSLFLQSISQANTYKILQGYLIRLNLSRSIRKFIIPNWKAIMGFRPDYIIKPYITSRKDETRMTMSQMEDNLLAIFVRPDFDITTVETEQRSHTVSAWSLAILAYKLLFGDDAIRPFGLIQKRGYFYERTQKKLTKFLSTFPLIQLSDSSNNIDDVFDDDESRVNHLERKINDLELFLRDYVVEVQQLDKAYKNTENAKDQ